MKALRVDVLKVNLAQLGGNTCELVGPLGGAGVVGCPNLPAMNGNYDVADAHGTLAWATRGGGAFGCACAATPLHFCLTYARASVALRRTFSGHGCHLY